MKVLVTGGTGFLGRHLALRLKHLGHATAITGRNDKIGQEMAARGIEYLRMELTDAAAVRAACRGVDQVVHSAGLASPWGKYRAFFDANVVGTRHVVEASLASGVKRLVHLSTPSLYFDYRHRLNIKESEPLPRPRTAYAATKLLADREVEAAHHKGLPMIGLRPRALVGPGDLTVLGRVLKLAQSGKVPLVGGGVSYADLTYIDNAVDAVVLALEAPEQALGRHYNVTNGEPMRFRDLLDQLLPLVGLHPKYRSIPFPVAYSMAAVLEAYHNWFKAGAEPAFTRYGVGLMAKSQTLDIGEARRCLGYSPKVALSEGFRRFAAWWNDRASSREPGHAWGLPPRV